MLERYQAMQIAGSWWCFGWSTVPLMAALHTSRWLESGLHRISRFWSDLNDINPSFWAWRGSKVWIVPMIREFVVPESFPVMTHEIFDISCCSCSDGHPCQVDGKADGRRSYGWKAVLRRGPAASWTSLTWFSWRPLGRLRALICLWLMWFSESPFWWLCWWVDWWINFLIHSRIRFWINCRIKVFLCLCSFGHLNGSCCVRLWSFRI